MIKDCGDKGSITPATCLYLKVYFRKKTKLVWTWSVWWRTDGFLRIFPVAFDGFGKVRVNDCPIGDRKLTPRRVIASNRG